MLALAFSVALRSPPTGTGIIPIRLYRNVEAAAGAVHSSGGLLTYPVVTPLDAVLANFIFSTLTMLVSGTLNCVLIGFFPTWENVWTVETQSCFWSLELLHYDSVPATLSVRSLVKSAYVCGRHEASAF